MEQPAAARDDDDHARLTFDFQDRVIADDIARSVARTIAGDVEVDVRRALAQAIAASADIPETIALRLAQEVIEVAGPVLKDSDLIGDETLANVVEACGEADAALPPAIAERLVTLVANRLKTRLAGSDARLRHYAAGLSGQVSEGAAVILGGGETEVLDLLALVDQLQASGKLLPSLVLRAARRGDREFVQAAVSRLSGLPYTAVAHNFAEPASARRMLAGIGLCAADADAVLRAA